MSLLAVALLAQLAATSVRIRPVLEFPVAGLDDSASYQGYHTRFFRDAARNTVQIYLDRRQGRVVHLLADAENESIGFTARDASQRPASLNWRGDGASVSRTGRRRSLEYTLSSDVSHIELGWFLLGSMRVERDFQASLTVRAPFDSPPFSLPEIDRLIAALDRLEAPTQQRHLALLRAPDVAALRNRVQPTVLLEASGGRWVVRVHQPSLDGRDTLSLELGADQRRVNVARNGGAISLRARTGNTLSFTVRIVTSGTPLTPLARHEIFTPHFLEYAAGVRAAGATRIGAALAASRRARWMERQVRGVELLASREKLMAGLPTYATYFGRDMLMTALMMRPIWRETMSEFVIASVLRKLSPTGQVSHEEALGGQAVREGAEQYAALMERRGAAAQRGDPRAAESLLDSATIVLRDLRAVRENYHMVDDEFQFPVLVARWIGDPGVSSQRKRAFLLDSSDGTGPRLHRLLRELALVARMSAVYANDPSAPNLVSFAPRADGQWATTSWRDSNAGYGGGRFAMDINAIWVPMALESVGQILESLATLGFAATALERQLPALMGDTPLGRYARDSRLLRAAITTWRGAERHFVVSLAPPEVRSHVAARLAAMPAAERAYWTTVLASTNADRDSLVFMALALDAEGRPIGVANTDPATRLFLGEEKVGGSAMFPDDGERTRVLRDVRLFTRPYPVGLYVSGVGSVVANDAYAPAAVWHAFERDPYHGPRVVWGREVNLFLLGVASRLAAATGSLGAGALPQRTGARDAYVGELRTAMQRVQSAVEASGFRSELWSYDFIGGRPVPVRYGSGSDVQLWSTTDLVVQYTLSRLKR